jgi:peptidoglycan/LPS O-acetylase OafA/YrhL
MIGTPPREAQIFFPNLNGIRFIAAFLVILHHIEQYKFIFGDLYGTPHRWHWDFFRQVGPLGVFLFFVLSGFLITYLLLVERDRTGTIGVRNFYLRRVLRIWPLYYFIVALGLFVLPQIPFFDVPGETDFVYQDFGVKLLLFLLILPNVATGVYPHIPYLSQSWSIGVEEQFYYFWPWVVRGVRQYLLPAMIGLFFLFFLGRGAVKVLLPDTGGWVWLQAFVGSLRISCMMLGALGAYLIYYHADSRLLRGLFARPVQVALWALIVGMIATGVFVPGINQEVYSLVFALLIINLAANPATIVQLTHPILEFLGKISYGLYMYHTIGVVVAIKGARYLGPGHHDWVIYPVAIGLSVAMATASYYGVEKPILKLKERFTSVRSGRL